MLKLSIMFVILGLSVILTAGHKLWVKSTERSLMIRRSYVADAKVRRYAYTVYGDKLMLAFILFTIVYSLLFTPLTTDLTLSLVVVVMAFVLQFLSIVVDITKYYGNSSSSVEFKNYHTLLVMLYLFKNPIKGFSVYKALNFSKDLSTVASRSNIPSSERQTVKNLAELMSVEVMLNKGNIDKYNAKVYNEIFNAFKESTISKKDKKFIKSLAKETKQDLDTIVAFEDIQKHLTFIVKNYTTSMLNVNINGLFSDLKSKYETSSVENKLKKYKKIYN